MAEHKQTDHSHCSNAWRDWLATLGGYLHQELGLLLALLIAVGGVWVFLEIADEVVEGERQVWDSWVIASMREQGEPSDPIGPPELEQVAIDITALGGWAVLTLLTLLVVGLLLLIKRYGRALMVLFAVLGGVGLSQGLKSAFDRPRPDVVPHLAEVSTASFPSGHSMLSAAVYLTLGALLAQMVHRRRLKLYYLGSALFLTGLVGLTRVFLGVHYPSDVIAGWTLGLAWAAFVWVAASLYNRWRKRHRLRAV
ncbi:MAG: phosphatase PAP2 family protein [Phycisphaeraceae bacterium]